MSVLRNLAIVVDDPVARCARPAPSPAAAAGRSARPAPAAPAPRAHEESERVRLTRIMPIDDRTTGFSFAYGLATALFGGFTPEVTPTSSTSPATGQSLAAGCPSRRAVTSSPSSFPPVSKSGPRG